MMTKVYIFLSVFLLLLCNASCQDLELWTSLPMTPPTTQEGALSSQLVGGAQLCFSMLNQQSTNPGVLESHKISFHVLDDRGDFELFKSNIQYIIKNQTQNLGFVFASTTERALYIQSQLNNTIPFIHPISSHSSLRTKEARNIINIRPSNQAEVYGLLFSLRATRSVQRLAFFYQSNDADSEEAYSTIRSSISLLGLSLVASAESTSDIRQIRSAIKTIAEGNPTAIIIWSHSNEVTSAFLKEANKTFPADMIYALNYAAWKQSHFVVNLTYLYLPAPSLYTAAFLPFQKEQADVVMEWYNASRTPAYFSAAGPYGFEGYFTARIITKTLERIRQYPVSQQAFLKEFYRTPLINVGGVLQGPIADVSDGSLPTVFPQCNELTHRVNLVQAVSGLDYRLAVNFVPNSTVSWQECSPSVPDQKPINFGTVYDPNDAAAMGTIKGIELAFTKLNNELQSAHPLQLVALPVSKNTGNYTEAVVTLVERYNITALVSLSAEAALAIAGDLLSLQLPIVDIISSSSVFRNPDDYLFINIRVGIHEQVLASLYQLLSVTAEDNQVNFGVYYQNDAEGLEFVAEINSALKGFNTYLEYNETIPTANFFKKNKNKLNWVFNMSSDDRSLAQPTGVIDYLLVSSRESDATILNLIQALNREQLFAPKVYAPSSIDAAPNTQFEHMQVILHSTYSILDITKLANATGVNNVISVVSQYPGSSPSSSTFQNPITIIQEYADTAGKRTYDGWNIYAVGGYMTGRFLSSVLLGVTGYPDHITFYRSIFNSIHFNINGILLGPFGLPKYNDTIPCNSGPVVAIISRPVLAVFGNQTIIAQFEWPDCTAITPHNPRVDKFQSAYSSSSSGSSTAIIASVVVVVGVCIICIVVVVAAIILFFIVFNPKQRKRRHLKPPRYELYATKSIFYAEKANIDAMFIASSPTTSTSSKRQMLDSLEQFILQPKIAYPVLQSLTKAGMSREEVSAAILYIYFHADQSKAMLNYGIQKEIVQATEESTLFREDSPLAALWQSYVRLVGIPYLWYICAETLYDTAQVSGHFQSDREQSNMMLQAKSYEVDKTRLNKQSAEDEYFINILHLKLAAQCLFNKVRSSPFPHDLKWFLDAIRRETQDQFSELTNGVIANFVFLRFICLAVTTPNTFGIWKKQPSTETLRFLVLLSKVLQNLAFGVEFEKEGYMKEMNDFIVQNRSSMNTWLEKISTDDDEDGFSGERVTPKAEVKDNCLKWLFCNMHSHRQALKRELRKRVDANEWSNVLDQLEEMKILHSDESSDSATNRTNSGSRTRKEGSSAEKDEDLMDRESDEVETTSEGL